MDWEKVGYDTVVLPDFQKQELYNQQKQAEANQAIAAMISRMVEAQDNTPQVDLPGINPNPLADRERDVGLSAMKSVTGSPDLANIPTNQLGSTLTGLFKSTTAPDEFRAKAFETLQRQKEIAGQKATAQQDLQAQRAQDRADLQDKMLKLQQWQQQGLITPDELERGKQVALGLPNKAAGGLQEFYDFLKLPAEQQQAYLNFIGQKAQQQHITVGQRPEKPQRSVVYNPDGSWGWADSAGGYSPGPAGTSPQKPVQIRPADISRIDKETRAQLEAIKIMDPSDPVVSETLADLNSRRQEAGLLPFVPTTKTFSNSRTVPGTDWKIPGFNSTSQETNYAPGAQTPVPPGVGAAVTGGYNQAILGQSMQPQNQQVMPTLPNPATAVGRTVKDTRTGQRYQSNGRGWIKVK